MVMFDKLLKFMGKKDKVKVVTEYINPNIINVVAEHLPEAINKCNTIFNLKVSLNAMLLIKGEESAILSTNTCIKIPQNCCGIVTLKTDGLIIPSGFVVITPDHTTDIKIPVKNMSQQKRVSVYNNQVIAELFIINLYTPEFVRVKRLNEVTK